MKSRPVRDGRRRSMLSGPVSESSVGPVTAGRPMSGDGSVMQHSAGAVKHNIDRSLGEQVYDAQRALRPLQDRLRLQPEVTDSEFDGDMDGDINEGEPAEQGIELSSPDAVEEAPEAAEVVADDAPAPQQRDQPVAPVNDGSVPDVGVLQ
jgi:hypothetical protein